MFGGTDITTRDAEGREGTWKSSQTSLKTKPTAHFAWDTLYIFGQ